MLLRRALPRIFSLLMLLICALPQAAVADAAEDLKRAYGLMRAGKWTEAVAAAGEPGSLGRDILVWHRLRTATSGADFADYRSFLTRRPDWPGEPYARRMGERTIPEGGDPARVVAYFDGHVPQTGKGVLRLIAAKRALGHPKEAEAEALRAWKTMVLSAEEETALLALYPKALAPLHVTRLDHLLWEGEAAAAERMLSLVPDGHEALARARLALRASASGVDALIAAVPATLAADPGLAYERYLWRKRGGRSDGALDLIRERSVSAASLGRPEAWARDRGALARQLMRTGRPLDGYDLASRHFLEPSASAYADLEWLSGYIALQYLEDPDRALEHFNRFRARVLTPISLGRAGYWEGRALEAKGAKLDAQAAYEFGAEFQTSFYGLLAAEKAGLHLDPALLGQEQVPDWRGAAFMSDPLMQAALLLLKAGDLDLAERFMRHLCESLNPTEIAQMADMTLSLNEPHLALRIAKFAADQGVTLSRPYYPLHPLAELKMPPEVPVELALAIARRESEFDPVVVSPVGARGLMQIMPKTAEEVAGKLGLDYELRKLTTDQTYNATLGTAYLAELVRRFGANWMLVSAAYNAGPSRPQRWLVDYGDPRDEGIDPIDWIEQIPFEETRNYVMRVTESLPIYRARLTGKVGPIDLSAVLKAR